MQSELWLAVFNALGETGALLAQGRMYEWHWEMHPMWWWGWAMMAMMFLFWVLFIVGLVVGIRWLLGKGNEQKQDSAHRDPASEICPRRDQQRGVRGQKERSWRMKT